MIREWPAKLVIACIRAYQLCLSPFLGRWCRFTPTCSAYALEAVRRFGAIKGTALGVWRILRCNPFCAGGYDPVPGKPGPGGQQPANDTAPH